jgi:hypothetical protein
MLHLHNYGIRDLGRRDLVRDVDGNMINRERARQSKKRRLEKQPSEGLVSKNQHKKPKLRVASGNDA